MAKDKDLALDELSDTELIQAMKDGSGEAFDVLVERHQNAIVNYATHVLRDRTMAMDVAQETFLRAFRAAARYEPTASVKTWLFTIANHLAISEIRREKRWSKILFRSPDEETQADMMEKARSETLSPDASLGRREVTERVRAAIRKLPEKYRTVIVLRDLQGLSYEEIEAVVGCPLGTVKSRVNRARLMLRDNLKDFVET